MQGRRMGRLRDTVLPPCIVEITMFSQRPRFLWCGVVAAIAFFHLALAGASDVSVTKLPTCDYSPAEYMDTERCRAFTKRVGKGEIYFHAIFDFIRPSSIALMTQQVCRILENCISPENFKVILHSVGAIRSDFRTGARFLKQLGIKYLTWKSTFDSASAQFARLHILDGVNRTDQLILQADIDEFPDLSQLSTMSEILLQLESPCDLFSGTLQDRMPLDGSLVNVTVGGNLQQQFPLQCEIKKFLEKAAHKKIVLYRASFRPEVGNHRLRCQRAYSVEQCLKKKLRFEELYPTMPHTPRQCSSRIMPVLIGDSSKSPLLNAPGSGQSSAFGHSNKKDEEYSLPIAHYKYVWGLKSYLEERVRVFKEHKIRWYKESQQLLDHIEHNDGKICVQCPEVNCAAVSAHR